MTEETVVVTLHLEAPPKPKPKAQAFSVPYTKEQLVFMPGGLRGYARVLCSKELFYSLKSVVGSSLAGALNGEVRRVGDDPYAIEVLYEGTWYPLLWSNSPLSYLAL